MKISLKPVDGGEVFVFPALPEKIDVKTGAKYQTFDILSKGEIKIPRGRDSVSVTWSHVFFGKKKRNEAVVETDHWREPKECVKLLKRWMNNGEELNLIVSGGGINLDVTISSFQYTQYGAFGNIKYTIVFDEVRPLKVYTTKEKKIQPKKKTKSRSAKKTKQSAGKKKNTYTVVKGDTLWGISKRFLGSGSDWIKLYDKNKNVIESAAKAHGKSSSDHGRWIWAGTVLTIP